MCRFLSVSLSLHTFGMRGIRKKDLMANKCLDPLRFVFFLLQSSNNPFEIKCPTEMLTKETVPLTSDGRWDSLQTPAVPCMSIICFCLSVLFAHAISCTKSLQPQWRQQPLRPATPPDGNAPPAHAHAHWHPCSCQSMCRVTVSLHLSVTCMSVCLFYVTPGERISNSSRFIPTCKPASLPACFLALLSFPAYLPACLLCSSFPRQDEGGEEEAGPPVKDALQAMDGFLDSQLTLGLQV